MISIGVRELKQHASKFLRRVREEGEIVEVTFRGEAIARIVPVQSHGPSPAEVDSLWTELDDLAAEISAAWPQDVSAELAIAEERRNL